MKTTEDESIEMSTIDVLIVAVALAASFALGFAGGIIWMHV